jgi:hypothetical protein
LFEIPTVGHLGGELHSFILGIQPEPSELVRSYVSYECAEVISLGLDYVLRHRSGEKA